MKILDKITLCDEGNMVITKLNIYSPDIAGKVKAGQFVVVMAKEEGERIPLTIVDKNLEVGSITLIFQEVGLTTKLLGKLGKGDFLYALAGPLGHATEIKNYGRVILVGGGVGIAEIYPVAKALKETGSNVTTVIGARNKNLLILEHELKKNSDKLYIVTDDGSYGEKGFTTDVLKNLLALPPDPEPFTLVYAVGPIPMMKKAALVTKDFNLKTIVSLNSLMVDATGMCGCCRVSIGDKVKFACIDGPDFDAHLVNWNELEKRNKVYVDKENHICKLNKL